MELYRRAFKERWPIPPELRPQLAEEMRKVLLQSDDIRTKVAAAKALLEADKVNLEQEKRDAGGDVLNINLKGRVGISPEELTDEQLIARALELESRVGAGGSLPGTGQAEAGPDPS